MSTQDGKNLGCIDGGRLSTRAELELERAARELFFAMRGKDGKLINKNFRNVTRGQTSPLRQIVRRFKEAKAARNDARNYPLMKKTVRELDRWVDALHGKATEQITGEHSPAA
jgi:hypothetical protein